MRVEVALTQHLVADMHPGGVPGAEAGRRNWARGAHERW